MLYEDVCTSADGIVPGCLMATLRISYKYIQKHHRKRHLHSHKKVGRGSVDSELGGFILSFIEDRHRRCAPCVGIMSICFLLHPTSARLLGAGGEDIRVTCNMLARQNSRSYEFDLPASRMDMVEQRKSLPQAVPSSICIASMLVAALRSHNRTSSQGQPSENTQSIPEYLVVRP